LSKIKTKRVNKDADPEDGYRILTERLWPHGVSKEQAQLDQWMKGALPSHNLRKWVNHESQKRDEFQDLYRKELYGSKAIHELIEIIEREEVVTFVFASKDEEHNSTVFLKEFIE
jgi:uncharacterized protein YeaO (DUF488 family)